MSGSDREKVCGSAGLLSSCLLLIPVLLLLFHLPRPIAAGPSSPQVITLEVQGAISPALSDFIKRGMARAVAAKAELVILQMDTPGGLDRSMRDIIQLILASSIPVVSYVAPEGARAASAGTYILYASHVAAMAPATNLGAATPVSIGGLPGSEKPREKDAKKDQDTPATDNASTMKRKVINDASAYIQALAERHGRNAQWAVRAVREAVSLSAKEALEQKVIDFLAPDLTDLLRQLDGHQVQLDSGPHVISTGNAELTWVLPSWRDKLLGVISDPNVAYFLLLLGFYGLIYELANPGVFFPGVAGAIALLLAFYAFQVLPINYSGLALMLLGLGLLLSEAFIPSFGSLGIGGIIAMAVGSLILIDDESLKVSLSMVFSTTALFGVLVFLLVGRVLTMRKKKVRTGEEALVGMTGEAANDFQGEGRIWLLGESWQARSREPLIKGEKVRVSSRNGLKLTVERFKEGS